MKFLVIGLLAALVLPGFGVAIEPHEGSTRLVTLLPGQDADRSPHATWRSAGLVLVGVPGGRLVVDEALILRIDADLAELIVEAPRVTDPHVHALSFEFRQGGTPVGTLDVAGGRPRIQLGSSAAGTTFEVAVVLELAADTPLDSTLRVPFRIDATPRASGATYSSDASRRS